MFVCQLEQLQTVQLMPSTGVRPIGDKYSSVTFVPGQKRLSFAMSAPSGEEQISLTQSEKVIFTEDLE